MGRPQQIALAEIAERKARPTRPAILSGFDLASSRAPGVRTSRCGPQRNVRPGTAFPRRLRLMASVAPNAMFATTRSKVEQGDLAVDVVYPAPRAFGETPQDGGIRQKG